MNLAIAHYHLNRGGVTQVIMNHLRALDAVLSERQDRIRVAVLHGGRLRAWPRDFGDDLPSIDLSLHAVPELEYDRSATIDSDALANALVACLDGAGLDRSQTVLHFHNHSLGKNASVPGAIAAMARAGYRFLLQIHDFAEDFRPANYGHMEAARGTDDPRSLSEWLYPQAPQIHYAALNGRDIDILASAGVDATRRHWLPNPVAEIGELADRQASRNKLARLTGRELDKPLLLYPVRGIRRKNLGEWALLAAIANREATLALTQPPDNPVEQPNYLAFKSLAEELQLSCIFEVGKLDAMSFRENLAAADAIVTTSVAEGFGMVFLEAWLAGRPLVGRNLPEITRDFVDSGLTFDGLYDRINVPIEWLGGDNLRAALEDAYRHVMVAYGQQLPTDSQFAMRWSELSADGLVDFSQLDRRLQTVVIKIVARDSRRRGQLLELNPEIMRMMATAAAGATSAVEQNAAVVRSHYSLKSVGRKLVAALDAVAESRVHGEVVGVPEGHHILNGFISLPRLQPIRFEP